MTDDSARILIVDDEMGMREGCKKILTAEGYDVETAEDGLAGLDLFSKRGNFAAALIDLKMPRMSGLELIEKLRQQDPDVVLLVITAYATIDTAVEATKRGAYGYIPKPFTPDELLLAVRRGLERRALTLEAKRLREDREKRLLEAAFERSRSNTVINCMTDGVLVINRDMQIVLRNAAAARIIPECASLPLPAALSALTSAELRTLLAEALAAGPRPMILSREIPFNKCTYMVNASPVHEPNSGISGAVAVLRDITALKRLEIAKSMFVSMVAHEVKAPLAAIEGYLNLIVSGDAGVDPKLDQAMLHKAQLRAKSLRTMVSELMNLMAIQTGSFTIKRAPLDITKVVAEAVDAYKDRGKQKGIELSLVCEGTPPDPVLADRDAMLSVFTNLIDNAIKYTPPNGHAGVRIEYNGLYAKVTVWDDGIGMASEETDRVFEEFFRAKNEYTSNVPGTGLGLAIVKRLVDMHHGTIAVKSAPGKGSEFAVSLPLSDQR